MPQKKRRRRAVIGSIAPYSRPTIYSPIGAVFGLAWWAVKAVVGLWALYWCCIIIAHLFSDK